MKKQLDAINKSVATGHPKIAIASLCAVIKALIVEIENLKRPKITLTSPEQTVPIENSPITCVPTKSPVEQENGPIEVPGPREGWRDPQRRFNAGDAE